MPAAPRTRTVRAPSSSREQITGRSERSGAGSESSLAEQLAVDEAEVDLPAAALEHRLRELEACVGLVAARRLGEEEAELGLVGSGEHPRRDGAERPLAGPELEPGRPPASETAAASWAPSSTSGSSTTTSTRSPATEAAGLDEVDAPARVAEPLFRAQDPRPIHSSPPSKTSFFHSGTSTLSVSIASLQAASASARWGPRPRSRRYMLAELDDSDAMVDGDVDQVVPLAAAPRRSPTIVCSAMPSYASYSSRTTSRPRDAGTRRADERRDRAGLVARDLPHDVLERQRLSESRNAPPETGGISAISSPSLSPTPRSA